MAIGVVVSMVISCLVGMVPVACSDFVNSLEGFKDFFHGHGPFVVVGAGGDELVMTHLVVIVRQLLKNRVMK